MTRHLRSLLLITLISAACSQPAPPPSETLEVFGPYRGRSAELFRASLQSFAEDHNISIRYTGTSDFVGDLRRRVSNLNAPDIAIVPQLGLIEELWNDERILPLAPNVVEAVEASYGDQLIELGSVDGTLVGVIYRASVKSLVWFRPSVFESGGYEIPRTLSELERLAAQMQGDGLTPWCLSIQARASTGWVATDWVEDMLVRLGGPDLYQNWVSGSASFADANVESAFNAFADLTLARGRQAGGLERVLRTSTTEAHDPMFTDPVGCAMHRQAPWVLTWLPAGFAYGDPAGDIDVFVLPGVSSEEPPPLLIGGDHAVAFSDRAIVHELMADLARSASSSVWADSVAPTESEAMAQGDALTQLQAGLVAGADVLVFDGSDQMDPDFGSGLFWSEITAWVSGDISYEEMASRLDQARSDP
jgi:alpha-glucoside transport system substrate-binding protein